jgi:hypothetical protein
MCRDVRTGDVDEEEQRHAALDAELDEVRGLERARGEEDAVVGDDADLVAVDVREAGDERGAVLLLELAELAPVDEPRDHLARGDLLAHVRADEPVQLRGVVERRARGLVGLCSRGPLACARAAERQAYRANGGAGGAEVGDDAARDVDRVRVVEREVVRDAALRAMHAAAAERLLVDDLAWRASAALPQPRRRRAPVAALTSGGPARNTRPWFWTMTVSSAIAGTYAPPATEMPCTTATCGMRARERWACAGVSARTGIYGRRGWKDHVVEDAAEVLTVREHLRVCAERVHSAASITGVRRLGTAAPRRRTRL